MAAWPSLTRRPGSRRNGPWRACSREAAPRSGSGCWLAHQMFTSHPAQLRHAILLTDGKDEHESSDELDAAIS